MTRSLPSVAPDELRRAVVTALADARYRQNARVTGESLASLGGAKRAADRIEALGQQKS
jgi:UDP:flavonoid glycosyltransferase YjiC (YdhE family)